MKVKLFAIIFASFILTRAASAQTYGVHVTHNTNLRASYSLRSGIVETVPAGTILQVVARHNRWLKVNRNGTAWMADWVSHTRVEESASSQPQATTGIDNCCFVDRQCLADDEWINGYFAYQRNECSVPVQTQTQASTQPVTATAPITIPEGVDNCCQVDRQCLSDDDWVRGFYDYRDNQCDAVAPTASTAPITGPIPEGVDNCCFLNRQCHTEQDYVIGFEQFKYGLCHVPNVDGVIKIRGSAAFVAKTRDALSMLLNRAPKWYAYVQRGLWGVREIPFGGDSGIYVEEGIYRSLPDFRSPRTGEEHVIWVAGVLVHEACHVNRYKDGLDHGNYTGEKACTETQLHAVENIDPLDRVPPSLRWTLANIQDSDDQWWRHR